MMVRCEFMAPSWFYIICSIVDHNNINFSIKTGPNEVGMCVQDDVYYLVYIRSSRRNFRLTGASPY